MGTGMGHWEDAASRVWSLCCVPPAVLEMVADNKFLYAILLHLMKRQLLAVYLPVPVPTNLKAPVVPAPAPAPYQSRAELQTETCEA